jgi:hypothetical protein
MQSPAINPADPSDGFGAVDLTALSLEPALKGPAKTSNIFAFESGSTWGANNHGGGSGGSEWGASNSREPNSNNWDLPSSVGQNNFSSALPASFLSLPSTGNAWGGFSTPGGDQTKSTGD